MRHATRHSVKPLPSAMPVSSKKKSAWRRAVALALLQELLFCASSASGYSMSLSQFPFFSLPLSLPSDSALLQEDTAVEVELQLAHHT